MWILRKPTNGSFSVDCLHRRLSKRDHYYMVGSFKVFFYCWNHVLGYTALMSICGKSFVRCYSSRGTAEPVFLDMIGSNATIGPTRIDGQ